MTTITTASYVFMLVTIGWFICSTIYFAYLYMNAKSDATQNWVKVTEVSIDRNAYLSLYENEKKLHERARDVSADQEHTITLLSDQIAELKEKLASSTMTKFDPKGASNVRILAQALATEAGPKATYEECRAIAQVMFNRFYAWGNEETTIYDIVTAPGQFTAVSDGRWVWADPTDTELAAAFNCWNMLDENPFVFGSSKPDNSVLYFCQTGHEDQFFKTKLVLVTIIGETSFYQKRLEVR